MPKRKHHRDDYDDLNRKIRKLERKLVRKKRHRRRSRSRSHRSRRSYSSNSSDSVHSSRDSSQSPRTYAGELDSEHPPTISSPYWADLTLDDDTPETPILEAPLTNDKPNAPSSVIKSVDSVVQTEATRMPQSNDQETTSINPPATEEPQPAAEQIDSELLMILGEDPSSKPEFGKELHKELSTRLEHIATSGLSKETRKEISDKYVVPSNCTRIAAPTMNPEIKAALPELTLKRDKGLEARQRQLAAAITALGQAITSQMQTKDKNNDLLKILMDTIRILCDIQFTDSMKRRYFASSSLKKDINDQLVPTKIDKYLFGENLAETLKAAKAVSKSGSEIKITSNHANKTFKKPDEPQPSTSKNLNWKGPPARRQPTTTRTPRTRQPAPPRKHDTSSRPSRHQSRPTRRH